MTTITKNNKSFSVNTAYSSDFVASAKNLGGKWKDGEWHFDLSELDQVKDLCFECFGDDGFENEGRETCTVRIKLKRFGVKETCSWRGRAIANARGRDSGARLAPGIICESGEVRSGGSVKSWECHCEGTFLVKNFPLGLGKELDADEKSSLKIVSINPVKNAESKMSQEEILAVIEKANSRIAELEAMLDKKPCKTSVVSATKKALCKTAQLLLF